MEQQDRVVGGRYRLRERLGAGGMGAVWRAEDVVLGREVAVKEVVFPPGTRPEEAEVLRERTRREARSAARLDHPSAVTVYDVVQEDGRPWLVMELVDAPTLAAVVASEGPLPPHRAAQVGLAVLGALEAAHAQGIVHRDVKPGNVLLAPAGRVVLTDFGIATSAGDAALTSSGLLLGSPAYIAPERARGETPGPASDLWSLGATLFTTVEGRPPFDQGNALLTVTAVVTGEHAPYVSAGPLVPVLEGLLEKDPDKRLTAPAARRMLQEVADRGSASVATPRPEPAAERRVGGTAALDLGAVQQEIAGSDAEPTAVEAAGAGAAGAAAAAAVGGAVPAAVPSAVPVEPPPPRREPLARPAPAAGGGRSRRPGWLLPAAGAVAVVALAGGSYALTRSDPTPSAGASSSPAVPAAPPSSAPATSDPAAVPPPTGAATPTTSSTPSTTPPATSPATPPPGSSASPSSTGAAAGVPAGWRTYTGAAGWKVSLPPGWTSQGGGSYRDTSTGRSLLIETGPGKKDAVADRRAQARSFRTRHPSYQEIGITGTTFRGYPAADWEFTYSGLHVLDRVIDADGVGHSVYFQTRASDFAAARDDFQTVLATFQPS